MSSITLKNYRMIVCTQDGKELVFKDSDDLGGLVQACEKWERRGHIAKLFRIRVTELDYHGA